ncbi:MAG: site-2 protease family protein, partial [Phycisphaerae bacterium]
TRGDMVAITQAEWIMQRLMLAPPLLLSLVIHEYAHARTALAFGDPTAKNMGRLTLNPIAHLDPFGTLAILIANFGWAKPVPVNPYNLHPRGTADILVSLAGPASNLLIALVMGVTLRLIYVYHGVPARGTFMDSVDHLLLITMLVNILLCVFNLIPLFPLDGHHIVREKLPHHKQQAFMDWQLQYGRYVLLGLIAGPMILRNVNPGLLQAYPFLNPLGMLFRHAYMTALEILYAGLW